MVYLRFKGPYVIKSLLKKLKTATFHTINTWSRSSMVIPAMLGFRINIYNGKKHIPVYITNLLIGHKLGEFSLTRYFNHHKKLEYVIKKFRKIKIKKNNYAN
jgi:small subunit ribosomal protein S19